MSSLNRTRTVDQSTGRPGTQDGGDTALSKEGPATAFSAAMDVLTTLGLPPTLGDTEGISIEDLLNVVIVKIHTCKDALNFFWISYPQFISGIDLLNGFLTIFVAPTTDDSKRAKVLSCLERWTDDHWQNFNADFSVLAERIAAFSQQLATTGNKFHKFFESRVLGKILTKQQDEHFKFVASLSTGLDAAEEGQLAWEDLHPLHFAHQLTTYQFALFSRITPMDILFYKPVPFTSRPPDDRPLDCLIHHFNILAKWVKNLVLNEPELKQRQKDLKKIIAITTNLKESCNNYFGVFAIMAALISAPIYRLTDTWEGIQNTSVLKFTYEGLQDLVSPREGCRMFRTALKNAVAAEKPCIPYLGVYQSDLVHMNDAMQNTIDGKINFLKHVTMARTVNDILLCQNVKYDFEIKMPYQDFIGSMEQDLETDEDVLFNKSCVIQPKKKANSVVVVPTSVMASPPTTPKGGKKSSVDKAGSRLLKKQLGRAGSVSDKHDHISRKKAVIAAPESSESSVEQSLSSSQAIPERTATPPPVNSLTPAPVVEYSSPPNAQIDAIFARLESSFVMNLKDLKTVVVALSNNVAQQQNEITELKKEVAFLKKKESESPHSRSEHSGEEIGNASPPTPTRDNHLEIPQGPASPTHPERERTAITPRDRDRREVRKGSQIKSPLAAPQIVIPIRETQTSPAAPPSHEVPGKPVSFQAGHSPATSSSPSAYPKPLYGRATFAPAPRVTPSLSHASQHPRSPNFLTQAKQAEVKPAQTSQLADALTDGLGSNPIRTMKRSRSTGSINAPKPVVPPAVPPPKSDFEIASLFQPPPIKFQPRPSAGGETPPVSPTGEGLHPSLQPQPKPQKPLPKPSSKLDTTRELARPPSADTFHKSKKSSSSRKHRDTEHNDPDSPEVPTREGKLKQSRSKDPDAPRSLKQSRSRERDSDLHPKLTVPKDAEISSSSDPPKSPKPKEQSSSDPPKPQALTSSGSEHPVDPLDLLPKETLVPRTGTRSKEFSHANPLHYSADVPLNDYMNKIHRQSCTAGLLFSDDEAQRFLMELEKGQEDQPPPG